MIGLGILLLAAAFAIVLGVLVSEMREHKADVRELIKIEDQLTGQVVALLEFADAVIPLAKYIGETEYNPLARGEALAGALAVAQDHDRQKQSRALMNLLVDLPFHFDDEEIQVRRYLKNTPPEEIAEQLGVEHIFDVLPKIPGMAGA